ncbi:copper amine oxidase N-terminal domain-containing protein [Cohnella sp.]|uniref:copper amine oxidase N-terminal domain-containing protein n=1 Tax=Cohnella sp. TaxID=1883426 RepID=UPI003568EF01
MRKSWMIIGSCVMALSLMTGSAFAASGNSNGSAGASKQGSGQLNVDITVEAEANASVTSATYGDQGHNGYKGLLKAIVNVKDKPAGAAIAELLITKYDTKLTAEMKAELEAIVEADAALSAVADYMVINGDVNGAVSVQKEAVLADVENLEAYKKLGKLYAKIGKKGIKLYVNGEEPAFTTAPFVRSGKTLVPFRAIAVALKADVSWNAEERSVTVIRDGITVKLFIDSKTAFVDGKKLTLEVAAAIEGGSTVIPVRFVSEALKASVKWEAETKSVVIYE